VCGVHRARTSRGSVSVSAAAPPPVAVPVAAPASSTVVSELLLVLVADGARAGTAGTTPLHDAFGGTRTRTRTRGRVVRTKQSQKPEAAEE
jgi:hypothetical protein